MNKFIRIPFTEKLGKVTYPLGKRAPTMPVLLELPRSALDKAGPRRPCCLPGHSQWLPDVGLRPLEVNMAAGQQPSDARLFFSRDRVACQDEGVQPCHTPEALRHPADLIVAQDEQL